MSCRLFDSFSHVIIAIQVKNVCYQVQRILIILYLRVEARKVKAIGKIFFIDLAEVFIPPGRDKLKQSVIKIVANSTRTEREENPLAISVSLLRNIILHSWLRFIARYMWVLSFVILRDLVFYHLIPGYDGRRQRAITDSHGTKFCYDNAIGRMLDIAIIACDPGGDGLHAVISWWTGYLPGEVDFCGLSTVT